MAFESDPCEIVSYIDYYRLSDSDFKIIVNSSNPKISSANHILLQRAQPILSAVVRSFPMLKKLSRNDHNLNTENT